MRGLLESTTQRTGRFEHGSPQIGELYVAQRRHRDIPSTAGDAAKPTPTWFQTHGRDLKFLLIFGLLMTIYYFVTTTDLVANRFFPWYLKATTDTAGAVVRLSGYKDVEVVGNDLRHSSGAAITVERGCDAIAPTALFVSAVIASPAGWRRKLWAIVGGVTILMVVNLIRIISLYFIAIYWPSGFDVMHLDVWQAAFIFLAIVLWALWAAWAARRQARAAKSLAT